MKFIAVIALQEFYKYVRQRGMQGKAASLRGKVALGIQGRNP